MRHRRTQAHTILRDLGDGLILRRATPDDAEALAAFNARRTGRALPPAGLGRMADCLVEEAAYVSKISAVACTTISVQIGFAGSCNQGVRSAFLCHPVAPV
jgi:hypothetical protein